MKEGYYLSAYVEIDPLGNLYKFAHRHDQSIALWKLTGKQVDLIHYWELERVTGRKQFQEGIYSTEQFFDIVDQLIAPYGIKSDELVDIWGIPQVGNGRKLYDERKYRDITYHALSHISSSIFMDMEKFTKNSVLAFAVDGGSDIVFEKETANMIPFIGCWSQENSTELNLYPAYSPGFLWDCLRCHYDIREGTLMALASASDSVYYQEYEDILVKNNVTVKQEIYDKVYQIINDIEQLTEDDIGVKFNGFDPRFSEKDNKISMIMKIIQRMSERIMDRNIEEAIRRYGVDTKNTILCMSGGFALNCPCNTYLMKKYGFKDFMSVPCVNDAGMSLGIGLYAFYELMNGAFSFKLENAYYGNSSDVEEFLRKKEYAQFIEKVEEFDPDQVASDIENGPIVWLDGRSEVGPRALGSRSILGDPRKQETKDELNRIKQRQWWRPVAPIIQYEHMEEWFEDCMESPYMLQAVKIREEKENEVIAVVHMDKSARVQTIKKGDGPQRLEQVLQKFYEHTGVPILCNTSLNDKGEPIIDNIEQAISFALRKGIRCLYINGTRILLQNHKDYLVTAPLKREMNFKYWSSKEERNQLIQTWNPNGLDVATIVFYVYTKLEQPELLQSKNMEKILVMKGKIFMNQISPFLKPMLKALVDWLEKALAAEE